MGIRSGDGGKNEIRLECSERHFSFGIFEMQ